MAGGDDHGVVVLGAPLGLDPPARRLDAGLEVGVHGQDRRAEPNVRPEREVVGVGVEIGAHLDVVGVGLDAVGEGKPWYAVMALAVLMCKVR